jgi:hypothetical protein
MCLLWGFSPTCPARDPTAEFDPEQYFGDLRAVEVFQPVHAQDQVVAK